MIVEWKTGDISRKWISDLKFRYDWVSWFGLLLLLLLFVLYMDVDVVGLTIGYRIINKYNLIKCYQSYWGRAD